MKISYTTWDAIFAWYYYILHDTSMMKDSKRTYITGMHKLIKDGIIDYTSMIPQLTPDSYMNACLKLKNIPKAKTTTNLRKTCLKSFYNFVSEHQYENYLKNYGKPARNIPTMHEISFILSAIEERHRTKDLDPVELFKAVESLNERDSVIVCTMIFTGRTLEDILDLRKKDCENRIIEFQDGRENVPLFITNFIQKNAANGDTYAFTTANGKRLRRTQVIRNLKLASKLMGLDFEVTPKILQGYAIAYLPSSKKENLAKLLATRNCAIV